MLEEQTKLNMVTNFYLSQNIAISIGRVLNGKELPTLDETYPNLFEKQEPEDDPRIWQMHRDQMLDFANRHNAKLAAKGVDSK